MQEPKLISRLIHADRKAEKWGVVLSGGGTKGAYEIGAWQAILELRLPIQGISGTSIGALNAAMFLGCDMKHIEEIYRTITLSDIMRISGGIDPNKDVFDPSNLLAITKEYVTQRGLDNGPLRHMLETHLDIDRIYASPIDLGIVTYDIRSREPIQVFKNDIERNMLIEYLLASANFPIYKTQNVDGKRFMDGGLYDNMPFNLLIGQGYDHLVVIDIAGIGMTRKVERADSVYIKMVSCSEDLGGTFEFNRERMRNNMTLGYLDTLKAFHKLFGNYYFFRRPAFNDLLLNFSLETIDGLESAAKIYKIDRHRIYQADVFLTELEARHAEMEQRYSQVGTESIGRLDLLELRKLNQSGMAICAMENMFMEQPNNRGGTLAKTFPEIASAANAMIELKNFRRW